MHLQGPPLVKYRTMQLPFLIGFNWCQVIGAKSCFFNYSSVFYKLEKAGNDIKHKIPVMIRIHII